MRFILGLVVFLGLSGAVQAQCTGTDLIAGLPGEDRTSLDRAVGQTPYPEGLLWRATRGDTEITLFGTYHIRHPETDLHAAALTPYLAAVDAAYFEMNLADKQRAQKAFGSDPSLMFITEGPTLPDLLDTEEWELFRTEMQARGIPGFMAAKFKPIWGTMMLGIGPCQARNGALQSTGIDERLATIAKETGVPDLSLEDWRTVMTLADAYSSDEQLEMLRLAFAYAERADDLQYTLLQRYLAGEIALVWEYSRFLSLRDGGPGADEDFAEFEDLLLTRRNHAWVDLLLEQTTGKSVFVAAGAAHMPGENGVLNLLEQAGFTITALPFDP